MKRKQKPTEPSRRGRGRVTRSLPAVGATMLAGIAAISILPPTSAQAAVVPVASKVNATSGIGPGDILDYAKKAYYAYEVSDCVVNNKDSLAKCLFNAGDPHGEPSRGAIYEKITALSASFDEFKAQYRKDHQDVMQTLNVISGDQKETALAVQVAQLRDDSERAHVSIAMAGALTDCSAKVLSPDAAKEKCEILDSNGLKLRSEPATPEALNSVKHRFLAMNFDDGGTGKDLYNKSPAVYSQILAGSPSGSNISEVDPYSQSGVLRWTLDTATAAEVRHQGFPIGTALTVLRPSYVNAVEQKMTKLIDDESGYYMTRILAAKLAGRHEQAQSLTNLSENGRKDSSPVLSIAEQREVYGFPGWTPEKPLQNNQYLLRGQRSGLIKVTVNKSTTPADNATLPTGEQVAKLSDDMGFSGTHYYTLTNGDPYAFPEVGPQLPGQQNWAIARYFTKAQGDVVASDPYYYRGASGKQLFMIQREDGLFHNVKARTGENLHARVQVPGDAHSTGPANVVYLQTDAKRGAAPGEKRRAKDVPIPYVLRNNDSPEGFFRSAHQPDLDLITAVNNPDVFAMAPQLSGAGHYDGNAYPALNIVIQPMSRGGALLPVS